MTHLYDQKRQLTNTFSKTLLLLTALVACANAGTHLYDKEDWDKYIDLAGDKLIFVVFLATFQPFSADVDLTFIKLKQEYSDVAAFYVIEVTEAEELQEELDVQSTPAFWVMKDKKKIDEWESIDGLRARIEGIIKKYTNKE